MFDWIANVPALLELVILVAAFVAAVFALRKTVYLPLKRIYQRWDGAFDTLRGYPAVLDPGSGRELKPATPPLANRVDTIEDAVKTMVSTQADVVSLQRTLTNIGEQMSNTMEWQQKHEQEAAEREARIIEYAEQFSQWEAWRIDANVLLEAIKNSHELPHK